jgi:methylenetetrahydrofolate dehydrogenase (NADP+)/methenyltetrahydrofolate cyclohydrolase
MTAKIIDGSAIAAQIQQELKGEIAFFTEHNVQPCLAVVLVGDNPASKIYVRRKREACEAVGIRSELVTNINNHYDLMDELAVLNRSRNIHGILVQLPLPKDEWGEDYNLREVFEGIAPWKDVDVFHPENVGLLVQGRPRFLPCTPHGIQIMLARSGIQVKGKHVVVINRSNIVGKPLSSMLIQDCDEYANATVTVCHDNTPPEQLKRISRSADVIVVAVGIPGFLKADMVGAGAVVVDVGITRVNGKILGDVDSSVREVAGWVTPVPGGVGPMTVTMLLVNTLKAARMNCHERKL